jgi:diguanylate cyclase (GGDEF)-like protein
MGVVNAAHSHGTVPARRHEQSGSLFRSLSVLALAGHVLILVATLLVGIRPLVIINVVSVSLYATALVLNRRRWYLVVLAIGLVEVTAHAVVATAILGWSSGFHIYLLALVPLVFFFDPWSIRARAAMSLVIVLFYVVFAWFSNTYLVEDLRWFVEWFRYGNLFVGAIVLSALSYYYGTAVRRAQLDLEAKNSELDSLARTDPLTGLPNRREGLARMEWERIRSTRSRDVFGIAVVDIDYFKRVNDEHGHHCGDRALERVASVLRGSLRAQDSVARWGGEEFLILLPGTNLEGVRVAAEKARAAVAETDIPLEGTTIRVSVSVGVAAFDHSVELDEVLKNADRALYRAKELGRDRVEVAR